jgi:RimJ/RimL family protein N-acetyltransferase
MIEAQLPPYRIETDRLIIRCYTPNDAMLLMQAITISLEHLKPWMPWAHSEPEPLQFKIDRLRQFRAHFDLNEEFVYGIFDKAESVLIGGSGLHTRVGPHAFEIGYWINVQYIGLGYATETAAALTKVAFEIHKVKRVEIHCDPRNLRSSRVPQKLGYKHDATLRSRVLNEKEEFIDSMIWSILEREYQNSPIKKMSIKAFDAINRPFY